MMEHSERLEQNVKAAEESLKRERQQVEGQKAEARNRTAEDQQKLNELMAERKELVAQIQPSIIGVYERLSRKYPEPLSEAVNGRCVACKLEIRPQLFQDLRTTDKLITCENCGRILYYNPPVAFDSDSGAPVKFTGGTRVDMS